MNFKRIDFSDCKDHDKTGKTSYSRAELVAILTEFKIECLSNVFLSVKEDGLKLSNPLENSIKINALDNPLLEENLEKSLIYIGYHDGNFKWTQHLWIGPGSYQNDEGTTIDGNLYAKIPKRENLGIVFSSLAEKIKEFGKREEEIPNILKMMKRNQYELKTKLQKQFCFGKGHLVAGKDKLNVKKDLEVLFECMKKSKEKANSGDYSPCDFTVEISSMKFFKFKKI